MRQEAAGHSEAYEATGPRSRFARNLVAIGEQDAAIKFGRRCADEGDPHVLWAVYEELAMVPVAKALELASNWPPHIERSGLSEEACRQLARLPEAIELVLTHAYTPEKVFAVAQGLAIHDLRRAIGLVHRFVPIEVWLGGDKHHFNASVAIIKVLHSALDGGVNAIEEVWGLTCELYPERIPRPYGFLLAGEICASRPELAETIFRRLEISKFGAAAYFVVAWLAARGGPQVVAQIDNLLGAWRADGGGTEKQLKQGAPFGVRELLEMLDLADPVLIPRQGRPFDLLIKSFDLLLVGLEARLSAPESKARAALPIGRFSAWIGLPYVRRFQDAAGKVWDKSWLVEFGEGVSISLAELGDYTAEREKYCVETLYARAANAAVKILANRDPVEAVELIDSVDFKYSSTRAEFVEITAVAMFRTKRGDPSILWSRLSPYTKAANFLLTSNVLTETHQDRSQFGVGFSASQYWQQVSDAIKAQDQRTIEELSRDASRLKWDREPESFRKFSRRNILRTLSKGLAPFNAARAMEVGLVASSFDETRALVPKVLQQRSVTTLVHAAEIVDGILVTVNEEFKAPFGLSMDVVLAFVLEFPKDVRGEFLDTYFGHDRNKADDLRRDVEEALQAFESPCSLIPQVLAMKEAYSFHWVAERCFVEAVKRDPFFAFGALVDSELEGSDSEGLWKALSEGWPVNRWREGFDAFVKEADHLNRSSNRWIQMLEDFAISLLVRLVSQNHVMAFEALDEMIDRVHISEYTAGEQEFRMIASVASIVPANIELWKMLVNRASKIKETTKRTRTFEYLLAELEFVPSKLQARCASLTIGAFGVGPCQPVLRNASSIIRAALSADPEQKSRAVRLIAQLSALLDTPENSWMQQVH